MEAILSSLSPEQVDVVLASFDSLTAWYHYAIERYTDVVASIVVDDVML